MRKEDELTPAEAEFEATLAGLQPAGASINRDQLMYQAGYKAGRRRNRFWQGATALLAVGLAASLAMQGLLHREQGSLQAHNPSPTPHQAVFAENDGLPEHTQDLYSTSTSNYIALRNAVLEKGLAALPCPETGSTSDDPPLTIESFLGRGSRSARAAKVFSDDVLVPGGRS